MFASLAWTSGWRPQGRPRFCWWDYVSWLTLETLQKELQDVDEDREDLAWEADHSSTQSTVLAATQKAGFKCRLPRSPDYFSPSDYQLFPKTKKEHSGHCFDSDDVISYTVKVDDCWNEITTLVRMQERKSLMRAMISISVK